MFLAVKQKSSEELSSQLSKLLDRLHFFQRHGINPNNQVAYNQILGYIEQIQLELSERAEKESFDLKWGNKPSTVIIGEVSETINNNDGEAN